MIKWNKDLLVVKPAGSWCPCFAVMLQQAFYYEGKAIMSNEEFDNLKEELMWEGSSVVMLSMDHTY